tara:strand:- start:22675 stop:24756 length:2082 start_codon:yes stop_codon:yes gene_type:complete
MEKKEEFREPSLETINLAVEAIEQNDLEKLKYYVQGMLNKYKNGSTSWLFSGIFYNLNNNLVESEKSILKSLDINPNYGEAHRIYADILRKKNRSDESLKHAKLAVEINQESAAALDTLGTSFAKLNNHQDAEINFLKAIKIKPETAVFFNNLGNTQRHLGKHAESIISLKKAKELSPNFAEIYNNLSLTYFEKGDYQNAYKVLKEIENKNLLNNYNAKDLFTSYGHICSKIYQFKKAKEYYKKALSLDKNFSSAHNGLAEIYSKLRQSERASFHFEKSIKNSPKIENSISNYILNHNYCLEKTIEEKFIKTVEFSKLIKVEKKVGHKNDKNPLKKLKVGFISGDFFNHPVSHFVISPLTFFNDKDFESYAYSNYHVNDNYTKELKKRFSYWRDIFALSEENIVKQIEKDRIDILFDLSGYTARNSIKIIKKKLSPIQISWLGYSGTTGNSNIDFILCDKIALPQEEEKWYTEKPLRMPDSYYCYNKPFKRNIKIEKHQENYTIYGCYNNVKKLNENVLNIWSEILNKTKKSKIIFKFHDYEDEGIRRDILDIFNSNNILNDRITFLYGSSFSDYIKDFNKIDISLDPFPYPGGTVTCHSLYMGVPVITLKGNDFLSRNTENILINSNLESFISNTKDEYIEKAVFFGNNKKIIEKENIRNSFLSSPILDGEKFSNELKVILREKWKEYCKVN